MIKFFRNIRQNLLNEGKTSRYLKYAIGEIILGMIGILLALQVNNWNDERKAKIAVEAKRQTNLNEIYHDLKKDLISLDTVVNQLQRQKEASIYLLKVLESKDKFIDDSLKFHHYQLETTYSIAVDRNKNTWDNLNASGQLLTLEDKDLIERLFEYYSFYDARIKNFNELPQEARFNNRKVGSPCRDLYDLMRVYKSSSTYPNANFYSCWLSYPGIHGLIIYVLESCYWNIEWFSQLKTQAQSIIDYMEHNIIHS